MIYRAINFVKKEYFNIEMNFFPTLLEPLGSKAPAFSSDSKISMFVRKTGESFALLCEPQAFPVALIRYVAHNR